MIDQDLAIVDIETTAAASHQGRIIEIAILRIAKGKIVDQFVSLVNPQQLIPPSITILTGINDEDVIDAPLFEDIADQINRILSDCVFVAHNARFDYGFIKSEFERLSQSFEMPVLCSLKLSRRLYPQEPKHNLDALVKRLELQVETRHRALDDAMVVWRFLEFIVKQYGQHGFNDLINQVSRQPSIPTNLDLASLNEIPDQIGVLLLKDVKGQYIYVKKEQSLREGLVRLLQNQHQQKNALMLDRARHVSFRLVNGWFGAQLMEVYYKQFLPKLRTYPAKKMVIPAWPFDGKVYIKEQRAASQDIYIMDQWCLLKALRYNIHDDVEQLFEVDDSLQVNYRKVIYHYLIKSPYLVRPYIETSE